MSRRLLLVAASLLMASAFSAQDFDFPKLPTAVPGRVARVNPDLPARLEALQFEQTGLLAQGTSFSNRCSKVVANSDADRQCAREYPVLVAAAGEHVKRCESFLKAFASASTIADTIEKNGPGSGDLPKAVEDAIAGAYRNSSSDVVTRVKKGFQAVQLRDWKVAAGWFKDALNREPANAGLKQLLAMVEAPPEPIKKADAAKLPIQLPSDSDVEFLFPGVAVSTASTMRTPGPDDVYYYRPTKGYTRMTAEGARLQQALDAMAGKAPGSIVNIR